MNLIVVSVSVLSLQIQRKSRSVLVYIYRPPSTVNIKTFFEEINEVISKTLCNYENLTVMGDFNIDIKRSNSDKDKLGNFCDLF